MASLGSILTGLNPLCLAGGAGSGNVVGPVTSTSGHIATFGNTTGTLLADGGGPPAQTANAVSNNWISAYNAATGAFTLSQPSFSNLSGAATSSQLPTSGVTAGTYGSATNVAQVTVDNKGRVTSATNVPITTTVTAASPGGWQNVLRNSSLIDWKFYWFKCEGTLNQNCSGQNISVHNASITASVATTSVTGFSVLTVSAKASGTLDVGQQLSDSGTLQGGTTIVGSALFNSYCGASLCTGSGSTGTYLLYSHTAQTISSESMTAAGNMAADGWQVFSTGCEVGVAPENDGGGWIQRVQAALNITGCSSNTDVWIRRTIESSYAQALTCNTDFPGYCTPDQVLYMIQFSPSFNNSNTATITATSRMQRQHSVRQYRCRRLAPCQQFNTGCFGRNAWNLCLVRIAI